MIVESSNTSDAKELPVATCKRYDVAPVGAIQLNVTVVDWFVAPLAGATSVGAVGVVVKLMMDPREESVLFCAATRK